MIKDNTMCTKFQIQPLSLHYFSRLLHHLPMAHLTRQIRVNSSSSKPLIDDYCYLKRQKSAKKVQKTILPTLCWIEICGELNGLLLPCIESLYKDDVTADSLSKGLAFSWSNSSFELSFAAEKGDCCDRKFSGVEIIEFMWLGDGDENANADAFDENELRRLIATDAMDWSSGTAFLLRPIRFIFRLSLSNFFSERVNP